MKKFPSLSYPNDKETDGLFADGTVVVQEKLDGANFRFKYSRASGFTFGSRRTSGENLHRDQFADPIEYVEENANRGKLEWYRETYGDLVFYGEAMIPHTISYDWETTPEFIGFDIWSVDEQEFLPTTDVYSIFEDVGLPTTPLIEKMDVSEWDGSDFEVPESEFYDGKAEGVVFKNHDTSTYGKFVTQDFKEKNQKTFGRSKKNQEKGYVKLSHQYVAQQRIEKAVHRLVDENEYDSIKMDMMVDLPEAVIRDMVEEEAGNIFMYENWTVDIGEFRSNVSSRCAEVLRRMVDKQAKEAL